MYTIYNTYSFTLCNIYSCILIYRPLLLDDGNQKIQKS